MLSVKKRLNEIYAHHTKQKISVIEKNMERDNFMDPIKAKEFGLIDEIITKRPEIKDK
jgi:ATP-dependent Clp protease protease subunit